MYIHIQLYRDINKIVYTYLNNTFIHTYNQPIFYTYSLTIILNTHKHSIDRIIICLLDDTASLNYFAQYSYTLAAHSYIHVYTTVCMQLYEYVVGSIHCLLLPGWLLCLGASSPLPHDHYKRTRWEQSNHPIRDRHTQWERDTSRWMIPPTTHRHTCRGTWHIWTHRHATAGYIVHLDLTMHYTMQR